MKKTLLSLVAIILLFGCKRTENALPPQAFDDAAFIKRIETISADAVLNGSHPGAKGKFWKILKIIGSDIIGGVSGALQGMELTGGTTAGAIIGGVAGAVSSSIKAAEQHAVSPQATTILKRNLAIADQLQFNLHVPDFIRTSNPYAYFGEFHNSTLAHLSPAINIEGTVSDPGEVQHHDSYNHAEIENALTGDPNFHRHYDELLQAGHPYTLRQYQHATSFVNIFPYEDDLPYLSVSLERLPSYGPVSGTTLSIYQQLFSTIDQLDSIEEVEDYIVLVTREVLTLPEDYADRDILLQTLAVAAYSADFWHTISQ